MTTQAPSALGVDIGIAPATDDADDLFTEVTGNALVRQDLRHRLTTDSVLGPGGDVDRFDIRKLLGASAASAVAYQARIRKVVLKDERIASATVVVTVGGTGPLRTLTIDVSGRTALGPFRLVFLLDPNKTTDSLVQIMVDQ